MKALALLAVAACGPLAHADPIQFEVLPNPAGIVRVDSVNNHGDVAGAVPGGWRVVVNGVVTDVPLSVPGTSRRVQTLGISDNGWAFGRAGGNGPFDTFTAVIWRPGIGWLDSGAGNFGAQSEAVGATADGRVLVRQGATAFKSYWWNPVSGSITQISPDFGYTIGCNAVGDAIIDMIPGRVVQAGGATIFPTFSDTGGYSMGLSSDGFIAGGSGVSGSGATTATGVIWNHNGQVVATTPLNSGGFAQGFFESVNASREAVGIHQTGADAFRAVYWSPLAGLLEIDPNLTVASAGWHIRSADRISDTGLILAQGYRPGSTTLESVLIRAVPEPLSFAPLALGFGVLLRRKRRS